MSGASSLVDNARVFLPDQQLVYDWLSQHGVAWCAYQSGDFLPFFSLMPRWLPEITTSLSLSAVGGRGRFRRYAQFRSHWTAGDAMPAVIFIEPEYTDGPHVDPNDDHPTTGQAKGQAFLADIYNILVSNPARWQRSMLIVTYDEHGGFFDHVPPLPIPTNAGGFQFTTTGVRVPAFVVSPQVAPGSVFSGNLDHTSILQLLADRFNAGQAYSAAVGERQPSLARLSDIFPDTAPPPRAPPLAAGVLSALHTAAANAPIPPSNGDGLSDPPNAQALHSVVMKVASDHPDLLAGPGWDKFTNYVKGFA
jgi:phospholipase C